MKRCLILVVTLFLTLACKSLTDEEVKKANLFFPPTIRYVEEPRFCFSAAERERARKECLAQGADTLFEFVVDKEGRVVKVDILRTHVHRDYREDMMAHAQGFQFTQNTKNEMYRAFFYPTKYNYKTEVVDF